MGSVGVGPADVCITSMAALRASAGVCVPVWMRCATARQAMSWVVLVVWLRGGEGEGQVVGLQVAGL